MKGQTSCESHSKETTKPATKKEEERLTPSGFQPGAGRMEVPSVGREEEVFLAGSDGDHCSEFAALPGTSEWPPSGNSRC